VGTLRFPTPLSHREVETTLLRGDILLLGDIIYLFHGKEVYASSLWERGVGTERLHSTQNNTTASAHTS